MGLPDTSGTARGVLGVFVLGSRNVVHGNNYLHLECGREGIRDPALDSAHV